MNIKINLDNNYLPDKYGKYAKSNQKELNSAIISFPFEIENIPVGTKSLALTFIDFDAVPVSGFAFIHWLACNLLPSQTNIKENLSRNPYPNMVQGTNSRISKFFSSNPNLELARHYIGPNPPDKDHNYTLCVYALDQMLDLKEGYYLNEFRNAIKGKILAKACLDIPSRV